MARKRVRSADVLAEYVTSRRALGRSERYVEWLDYTFGYVVRACEFLPRTPAEFEAVMATVPAKASDATRLDVFRGIRVVARWAAARHGVKDATLGVGKPPSHDRLLRTLGAGEVDRLLAASEGRRHGRDLALLLLLLDTGARLGEVVGLHWRDVVMRWDEDGTVLWSMRLVSGKTGEREVPMSDATVAAVRRVGENAYLFVRRDGEPLKLEGVQQAVKRAFVRAGMQGGPHLLRHTFATLFVENGGDAFTLQQIGGWTRLAMAERYVALDLRAVQRRHASCSPVARRFAQREVGDGRQGILPWAVSGNA